MNKKKRKYIKCDICGKFIGYNEFDLKQIIIDYTTDTWEGSEKTTFTHKECLLPK